MNQLHKFLKQHFTVRMIDGVEVKKPVLQEHKCSSFCKECTKFLESKEYRNYASATEVIKLPNWMEFWHTLRKSKYMVDSIIDNQDLFTEFMQQPSTIDKFVPWDGEVLEEPREYYENFLKKGTSFSSSWLDECEQYQAAIDKVIFEGWKVTYSDNAQTIIGTGEKRIVFQNDGTVFVINEHSDTIQVKTLDDLNRECQLFMKMK